MRHYKGQRKSKTNPKHTCKVCGDNIFNKDRNALYCKDCKKVIIWLDGRVGVIKYNIKKSHPGYKLTFKWKLKRCISL